MSEVSMGSRDKEIEGVKIKALCSKVEGEEGKYRVKGFRVMVMTGDGTDWQELAVANASLPAGEYEIKYEDSPDCADYLRMPDEGVSFGVDLSKRRDMSFAVVGSVRVDALLISEMIAAFQEQYRDRCREFIDDALDQLISSGQVSPYELNDVARNARERTPKAEAYGNKRKAWQTCHGPAQRVGRVK